MSRSAKVFWQKVNIQKNKQPTRCFKTAHSCPAFKHFTFHLFKEMNIQRLPELCLTLWRSLYGPTDFLHKKVAG